VLLTLLKIICFAPHKPKSMKQIIKRFSGCALLAAALLTPALSYAQGASTNAAATAEKPGPNRFYGPISKIDTNSSTFTVGDQTFKIIPESEITGKDGSKATLADAIVGEPARGTYTKKADGTLNVTKVRFGKKTGGKAGGSGGGKKKAATTSPANP
jgi:hypothetical protein